ncbi:hypothetical protein LMB39_05080 [Limosilactobacillus reuteri]|nr:hypothetical protein [Limosilactobacillus reuteri]MCC4349189.1 hypothetical protein [Limosilactobacillus reuteri]MCC4374793.1 hypothetical protein [Limosilactobacillus reuteri]MCC4385293.1 hypothetical protein [Limosilactobacillus reuteri]
MINLSFVIGAPCGLQPVTPLICPSALGILKNATNVSKPCLTFVYGSRQ